jgi:hypothetical protein
MQGVLFYLALYDGRQQSIYSLAEKQVKPVGSESMSKISDAASDVDIDLISKRESRTNPLGPPLNRRPSCYTNCLYYCLSSNGTPVGMVVFDYNFAL